MSKKTGEISLHQRGFGFVIGENEKYFVAEKNLNTAAEKDVVSYDVVVYKGREEAVVNKVIKRAKEEFIGKIINSKNFSFVESNEISKDIYINKKHTMKAKDGEIVRVKITNWGNKDKKPEGTVVRVYGDNKIALNVVNSKIDELNIPRKFSKEILDYTDNLPRFDLNKELEKRVDLRSIKHITIDGADTKDIDDAVAIEKNSDGYTLYVSIADVSYFVKEKSVLDDLALERGNSIYLYDRVIPMLPKRLTNDLCSLNPNEEKLAFTAKIEYDFDGKVKSSEFFKSIIISYKRCTYDEINEVIIENKPHEFFDMIFEMNELSNKLTEISKSRGAMEFEFPELKLILDENQKLIDIKLRNRKEAEVLIENFMIAANEQVASYMFYANIPSIYRIHEKPSIESMTELNEALKSIGLSVKNPSILGTKLQKIIEKTKNTDYGFFIHKLILRSMQKAIYSNKNEGHFGLSLDNYLHFTSPIRRYSDLVVHRILSKSLEKYIDEFEKKKLEKRFNYISKHISTTERRAQRLEMDAESIKLSEYMTDYIGDEFLARVTWVHNERIFVTLSNYIEAELLSKKTYNLNDDIKVKVISTKISQGKIFVEEV